MGFPCDSDGKESACNAGDPDSVPGSGRPLGRGNGNPLQYSCLGNPMDRGVWRATLVKSRTPLNPFTFMLKIACVHQGKNHWSPSF